MSIGKHIRRALNEAGMGAGDLAKMLSMPLNEASKMLNDYPENITLDRLNIIAEKTGMDMGFMKYLECRSDGWPFWSTAVHKYYASQKSYTVYGLRCEKNGKIWIGVSSNVEARISGHLSMLRGGRHNCKALQDDFKQYGEEQFKLYVIEQDVSYDSRLDREEHYIDLYKTRELEYGYNAKHPKPNKLEKMMASGLPPLPPALGGTP